MSEFVKLWQQGLRVLEKLDREGLDFLEGEDEPEHCMCELCEWLDEVQRTPWGRLLPSPLDHETSNFEE